MHATLQKGHILYIYVHMYMYMYNRRQAYSVCSLAFLMLGYAKRSKGFYQAKLWTRGGSGVLSNASVIDLHSSFVDSRYDVLFADFIEWQTPCMI